MLLRNGLTIAVTIIIRCELFVSRVYFFFVFAKDTLILWCARHRNDMIMKMNIYIYNSKVDSIFNTSIQTIMFLFFSNVVYCDFCFMTNILFRTNLSNMYNIIVNYVIISFFFSLFCAEYHIQ